MPLAIRQCDTYRLLNTTEQVIAKQQTFVRNVAWAIDLFRVLAGQLGSWNVLLIRKMKERRKLHRVQNIWSLLGRKESHDIACYELMNVLSWCVLKAILARRIKQRKASYNVTHNGLCPL